ncbi:MAG: cytochrome c-type biogenesis CcmF C-terminal domain-containing protein [Myxococcales bacterium]
MPCSRRRSSWRPRSSGTTSRSRTSPRSDRACLRHGSAPSASGRRSIGSILFWGLILALFTATFAWRRRRSPTEIDTTALAILLGLGAGFAFLVAGPASPFRDVLPPPLDGPGPNPLLQNHPLMAIHPPILYAGYVGMAVPFALALAAQRAGRFEREQVATLRAWLLVPWLLLTAGITLGARWAYDVLGWGGYWSWDPVENASLMPWLAATAALHALLMTERRGSAKVWSLTLVQSAFLLTLLGTFLTRSGVVGSVHSFAPGDVGPWFLALFGVALVSSVLLLASRAGALEPGPSRPFTIDREAGFFANNLVLGLLTFAVLLGTLYPVALRTFTGARASIGEEFYDSFAVPLGVALLFLMGVGPALPFGQSRLSRTLRVLALPLGLGLSSALVAALLGARSVGLLSAVGCAGFAVAVSLERAFSPVVRTLRAGAGQAAAGTSILEGRRRIGAHLAHIGIAVALVAVAASSSGRRSLEATLAVGRPAELGPYRVTFQGAQHTREPHRDSYLAVFSVERDGQPLGNLAPSMNVYFARGDALGTPAVLSSPRDDLYLSLLRLDPEKGEVALRVQVAPMVAWLWIGVAISVLGALVALTPGRRARKPVARAEESSAAPAAPAEASA